MIIIKEGNHMEYYNMLLPLAIILIVSKLLAKACTKFNLPTVVGLLITGLLMSLIRYIPGQTILDATALDGIGFLAKIGVILIMFETGLETDVKQLRDVGVKNIITFDAHDPRVMNAVPTMSFDNVMPTYQVLKCLLHHVPDVSFHKDNFMIVSPDEGAMNRNMYYSSVLGCNLGMFYKRRDYSRIVNGRNPIVAHEYLGESVEGKDVFIADDIIASGESMLDIAYELKMRGARNIFTCCTFPLFTAGLEKFDKAYNDGIIKAVLGTNLTYRKPELLEREWYYDVDVSKYTAYFIAAINHDKSVSSIIDPMTKIRTLLDKHGIPMGGEQ